MNLFTGNNGLRLINSPNIHPIALDNEKNYKTNFREKELSPYHKSTPSS
jgi:hypothetical protein